MSTHHTGEGWSERNPVPTVQEFRAQEEERRRQQEARIQHQEELRAATAHDNASHLASSMADEAASTTSGVSRGAAVPNNAAASSGAAPAIEGSLDGLRQRKSTSTADQTTNGASAASNGTGGRSSTSQKVPKEDGVNQAPGGGAEEKERIKKAQMPKGKANEFEEKGERIVTDPTTGGDVQIRDASENAKINPDKLDSRYGPGFSTHIPKDPSKHDPLHTSPNPAEPSNALLYRFPEPVSTDAIKRMEAAFNQLAIGLGASLALIWFFFAFGNGWWKFFLRTSILLAVGFCGWTGLHLQSRKLRRAGTVNG